MGTYSHCNNAGTFTNLFNSLAWGNVKFEHSNGCPSPIPMAARLLRLWVRIPQGAWVFVVSGQVEVSATS